MSDEALIVPTQNEIPVVEAVDHAATRPLPTDEQQRAADDVFSPEQNEAVAGLLAAQMGLGVLHNLVAESLQRADERKPLPRKQRPEGEES